MIFSHKSSLPREAGETDGTRHSQGGPPRGRVGLHRQRRVLGNISHACGGALTRAPRRRRAASAGAERDHRIRGRTRQMAHRTRTRRQPAGDRCRGQRVDESDFRAANKNRGLLMRGDYQSMNSLLKRDPPACSGPRIFTPAISRNPVPRGCVRAGRARPTVPGRRHRTGSAHRSRCRESSDR
jgi:hypothetical protein